MNIKISLKSIILTYLDREIGMGEDEVPTDEVIVEVQNGAPVSPGEWCGGFMADSPLVDLAVIGMDGVAGIVTTGGGI